MKQMGLHLDVSSHLLLEHGHAETKDCRVLNMGIKQARGRDFCKVGGGRLIIKEPFLPTDIHSLQGYNV